MGSVCNTQLHWPAGEITFDELKKVINTAGRGIPGKAIVQLLGEKHTVGQTIELTWDSDDWDELQKRGEEESVRRR